MTFTRDKMLPLVERINIACKRPMEHDKLLLVLSDMNCYFDVDSGVEPVPYSEMSVPDRKEYKGSYSLRYRSGKKGGKVCSLVMKFDAILSVSCEIETEVDDLTKETEQVVHYHAQIKHISVLHFNYNDMETWRQTADFDIATIICRKLHSHLNFP